MSQSVMANTSVDDYTIRSQLEKIIPIPNTTEFHFERTTERHCKYFVRNLKLLCNSSLKKTAM